MSDLLSQRLSPSLHLNLDLIPCHYCESPFSPAEAEEASFCAGCADRLSAPATLRLSGRMPNPPTTRDRIDRAMDFLRTSGRLKARDSLHISVEHADTCPAEADYRAECNCIPTVTFMTVAGFYEVDPLGDLASEGFR